MPGCLLWVNFGLSRPTAATSAFRGKADEIGTITDIGQRMSCVDGSRVARNDLKCWRGGRVQSCVRPVDAVQVTAGLDGFRGSGPSLLCGLLCPGHSSGCPNPRSDRFAITSRRPCNRRKALCLREINSSRGPLSCGSVRAVDLATGHDDPGDPRGLVGHGDGDQLVGLAYQQVGDPGVNLGLAPCRLKL